VAVDGAGAKYDLAAMVEAPQHGPDQRLERLQMIIFEI
jgi:hypothetical protein